MKLKVAESLRHEDKYCSTVVVFKQMTYKRNGFLEINCNYVKCSSTVCLAGTPSFSNTATVLCNIWKIFKQPSLLLASLSLLHPKSWYLRPWWWYSYSNYIAGINLFTGNIILLSVWRWSLIVGIVGMVMLVPGITDSYCTSYKIKLTKVYTGREKSYRLKNSFYSSNNHLYPVVCSITEFESVERHSLTVLRKSKFCNNLWWPCTAHISCFFFLSNWNIYTTLKS